MRTVDEIASVIKNFNLSVEDREWFIDTLTEEEMRNVFKQMCSVWMSKFD